MPGLFRSFLNRVKYLLINIHFNCSMPYIHILQNVFAMQEVNGHVLRSLVVLDFHSRAGVKNAENLRLST